MVLIASEVCGSLTFKIKPSSIGDMDTNRIEFDFLTKRR